MTFCFCKELFGTTEFWHPLLLSGRLHQGKRFSWSFLCSPALKFQFVRLCFRCDVPAAFSICPEGSRCFSWSCTKDCHSSSGTNEEGLGWGTIFGDNLDVMKDWLSLHTRELLMVAPDNMHADLANQNQDWFDLFAPWLTIHINVFMNIHGYLWLSVYHDGPETAIHWRGFFPDHFKPYDC